jgi:hypothetical protein
LALTGAPGFGHIKHLLSGSVIQHGAFLDAIGPWPNRLYLTERSCPPVCLSVCFSVTLCWLFVRVYVRALACVSCVRVGVWDQGEQERETARVSEQRST